MSLVKRATKMARLRRDKARRIAIRELIAIHQDEFNRLYMASIMRVEEEFRQDV